MPAILVEDLHKSYGSREVLRGVDLSVETGECLALLGPNGAGKTTIVEILEGHRTRTRGRVLVLDIDPAAGGRSFRDRIGIVLQEAGVEGDLRVGESLSVFARYYRHPRARHELLELVGLTDAENQLVKALSGGQRRRLDLALGLVGRPELVFLDEPTTGFDPAARRTAWGIVEGLKAEGTTVLLTTHYLEEASALADRVCVLVDGRILASGPPDHLVDDDTTYIRFTVPPDLAVGDLPAGASATAGAVTVRTAEPTSTLAALLAWSTARQIPLDGLTVTRPTLEDVYLRLTGATEPSA